VNASRSFEQRRAAERRGEEARPESEPGTRGAGWAGLAAGLLLAATLALWIHRLPSVLAGGGRWVLALAVAVIGAALLRSIGRR
jgi:hypothetical protein